jgi:hypothetical protein
MTGFEYLFGFFSLLMGIAAASVASGFAQMWRDRSVIRPGVCAPLFAAVVLLGVMNAWITFWGDREVVGVSAPWLISAALTSLPYVFASQAMFPSSSSVALEDHYMAHRRTLLAAIILPPIVGQATKLVLGAPPPSGFGLAYFAVRVALPVLLILLPQRNVQRGGLAALALWQIAGLFR